MEAAVESDPQSLGYEFTIWTAERLIEHLSEATGKRLSVSHLRSLLKQRGFVYRRPKHDLKPLQEAQARQEALELIESLKKKAQAGEILLFFVDETTLGLHPVLRACWMRRHQQKCIPAPGQQQWQHCLAAYNWADNSLIYHLAERKNSDTFIAFLDHLAQALKDEPRPIVLILDNASYHHSLATQAAFSLLEAQHIIPIWLPPYCSQLNLIERFWRHLKDYACANKLYPSMVDLIQAVERCLSRQNDFTCPNRFSFSKVFS